MTEINDDKDIEAIKKSVADSSRHWYLELVEKYENLKNVSKDNLPGLWDSLKFELAIQKILNIADCTGIDQIRLSVASGKHARKYYYS